MIRRGYVTAPDWAIKPDLVAPGVDVLSSTQDDPLTGCCSDSSGYTRLSGTSVSAAHVAGAAALMRQRWSWLSAYALRSVLMTTAKTPVWRPDGFAPPPAQVMERGSGRIDLGADLIGKPAFIYPPSHSFGSHNAGNGPVTVRQSFAISPWTSNRTWNLAVVETAGNPNLRATVSPSTLYVDSPKSFTLQVQVNTNVSPGEYEGFVRLTSGAITLRVPYWIKIVNVPIPPGTILLVDDDRNSEDGTGSSSADCSARYISALNTLGYRFTYWNTRENDTSTQADNGTPTQADMERASAVVWFTCRDLHTSLNFMSPIEGTEATELQNYLEVGGRLFITGQDIAYGSAPSFIAGLGARFCHDPLFDIDTIPTPSIRGTGNALVEPIAGEVQFDIACGGDGAGCALYVDEIEPLGNDAVPILFALPPNDALCQGIVGVKNSSEPTLEAPQEYLGRSAYLSFGFEDINNDPDLNGREELMKNILDWLQDDVSVVVRCAVDGRTVDCIATLTSSAGPAPARFRWDLGDGTTLSTGPSASIVHRYGSPGTFTIRVEATDSWGHKALDDARVTVR